ncbi:MAG: adenylate kinase [bacterium]|nr:adenylate kinase [bacterium]
MNIILLAPPAAGKGTQSELLIKKYQLNQISTGDLLRKIASNDSKLGNTIKKTLASGELVNNNLVFQVLEEYMDKNTSENGYVFDGFPRDTLQAEKLDDILENMNQKIDYVFYLNVSKEILLKRITGRRLCKSCGKVYNINIDLLKPKMNSICDNCGQELYRREDDNESSFETRYQNYKIQTQPLIDYYQNKNILYEIDSSLEKEEVFKQIESFIEKR